MHKVFGIKEENTPYIDRAGAYIVPFRDGCAGMVKTRRGCFLLGGGYEGQEDDRTCILRECLEEIGYSAQVWEQAATAEAYIDFPGTGKMHLIQSYYTGTLIEKSQEPTEVGHELVWIPVEQVQDSMYHKMQAWAVLACYEKLTGRDLA